jgi:hypothetical protein
MLVLPSRYCRLPLRVSDAAFVSHALISGQAQELRAHPGSSTTSQMQTYVMCYIFTDIVEESP